MKRFPRQPLLFILYEVATDHNEAQTECEKTFHFQGCDTNLLDATKGRCVLAGDTAGTVGTYLITMHQSQGHRLLKRVDLSVSLQRPNRKMSRHISNSYNILLPSCIISQSQLKLVSHKRLRKLLILISAGLNWCLLTTEN